MVLDSRRALGRARSRRPTGGRPRSPRPRSRAETAREHHAGPRSRGRARGATGPSSSHGRSTTVADALVLAQKHCVAAARWPSSRVVELDQVGLGVLSARPRRRRPKRRLRGVEELVRAGRGLSAEDEADEVGTRLDGCVDILPARQAADLDERPREQLAQLGSRIGCAHQGRADEHGVRAGQLGRSRLGAGSDRALGDHDAVARRPRDQLELAAVDRERGEIARVDADRGRRPSATARASSASRGSRRACRGQIAAAFMSVRRLLVVEVAQEQEHSIGARLSRLSRSSGVAKKPFASSGSAVARARRPEIVQVPAKRSSTSTDMARAPRPFVRAGELRPVGEGADVAGRRRAPLELGDRAEAGPREQSRNLATGPLFPPGPDRARSVRERDECLEALGRRATVDRLPCQVDSLLQILRMPGRRDRAGGVQQDRAERRPPSAPSKTSRIAGAFSAGVPPRSSAGSQRSMPSSSGSISRSARRRRPPRRPDSDRRATTRRCRPRRGPRRRGALRAAPARRRSPGRARRS